ncbi:hypothetical protein [Kosakonia oryziphila]|uniref:hypothetical protein n=1 Tax=Kosakonia oryziphila TaxID=1005667 RepID=UPI000B7F6726|nr:hypothetical protein [Kosakonia oryziphila]
MFSRLAAQIADDGTRSLRVNQSGWINIWMAILGQLLNPFPAFFDPCLNLTQIVTENFPDNAANTAFLFCIFTPLSV